MTNPQDQTQADELLAQVLKADVYDYLPEEWHSQSAIPEELWNKAFEKCRQRRLQLIDSYANQRALELLDELKHDIQHKISVNTVQGFEPLQDGQYIKVVNMLNWVKAKRLNLTKEKE